MHLDYVTHLEKLIGCLDVRIGEVLAPVEGAAERLRTIPGVNQWVAETVVSEIDADMDRFPDADHLASWAGMCSGNDERVGKRRGGRTTRGNRWLKRIPVQATLVGSISPRQRPSSHATLFGRSLCRES